mgnify:CR=1 FL=1
MGKFKLYNVDLKNLTPGIHEFEYLLENKFFVDIDGDQVQKGKVKVNLTVKRSSMMFEMNFQIEGVVILMRMLLFMKMERYRLQRFWIQMNME